MLSYGSEGLTLVRIRIQSILARVPGMSADMASKLGRIWLPLITLALVPIRSAGAADDGDAPDPIDKFYSECISQHGSTAGMSECTRQAAGMWDAEMNKAYNKLLGLLGPGKAGSLRESQRAWVQFRDQEFHAIEDIYSLLSGTMYVPAQEYSRLRITKERTLLLRHYIHLLEGG